MDVGRDVDIHADVEVLKPGAEQRAERAAADQAGGKRAAGHGQAVANAGSISASQPASGGGGVFRSLQFSLLMLGRFALAAFV